MTIETSQCRQLIVDGWETSGRITSPIWLNANRITSVCVLQFIVIFVLVIIVIAFSLTPDYNTLSMASSYPSTNIYLWYLKFLVQNLIFLLFTKSTIVTLPNEQLRTLSSHHCIVIKVTKLLESVVKIVVGVSFWVSFRGWLLLRYFWMDNYCLMFLSLPW